MKKYLLIALSLFCALTFSGCWNKVSDVVPTDLPENSADPGTPETTNGPVEAPEIVRKEEKAAEMPKDMKAPPVVMVQGKLYYGTGVESEVGRCGMLDGSISSSVGPDETPTEDNQSNFGEGYGYQFGAPGTIEVCINDAWYIFAEQPQSN